MGILSSETQFLFTSTPLLSPWTEFFRVVTELQPVVAHFLSISTRRARAVTEMQSQVTHIFSVVTRVAAAVAGLQSTVADFFGTVTRNFRPVTHVAAGVTLIFPRSNLSGWRETCCG